ncbi:MAG: hypothetical protein KDN22_30040 [Verrucomicrobiae bacterium]|nr:hypothetical protein [Verrucomicrobiae bacterium]
MKTDTVGTDMWCPECRLMTCCKAVSPAELDYLNPRNQRLVSSKDTDLQWFRRGRICQRCNHKFLTCEIQECYLSELLELREANEHMTELLTKADDAQRELLAAFHKLNEALSELQTIG